MANLCKELLRLFSLGQLAATEVQSLVLAASKDGWGRDYAIARRLIGASQRKHAQKNASNAVLMAAREFMKSESQVNPYMMVLDPADLSFLLEMYLPHEIFQRAVAKEPLGKFCLPADAFVAGEPLASLLLEWKDHPDVQFARPVEEVAMMGFHCDGVTYTSSSAAGKQKSVLVASLNIVSGDDEVRHRRFPLFCLRKERLCKCGCGGFCTTQRVFDVLAWSFRVLLSGRNPALRHDSSVFTEYDTAARAKPGEVIPHAALLQVRGDWEGLMQIFRLRAPKQSEFCWACDASSDPASAMSFHNFAADAPHRGTCFSHRDYLQRCVAEGGQPSNLFRAPGMQLKHVIVDSMHAADLGSFCDAVGSLFYIEVTCRAWHPSMAAGLVWLNLKLNKFYKTHKELSQVTPLVKSQIVSKTNPYPFLKAKAAPVRHVAEFCLQLAYKHMYGIAGEGGRPAFAFSASSPMRGRTQEHLQLMVDVFRGMERFGRAVSVSPFDTAACSEGMTTYLTSLCQLHKLWRLGRSVADAKRLPWQLRPKCHLLQHLVLDHILSYGSPAKFWCYRDEDFVGVVKRIASKTKHPWTLESRVLLKLRILEALNVRV